MEHTICYVEGVTEASRVCLILSRLLLPEYRVHYEPCVVVRVIEKPLSEMPPEYTGVYKIVVTTITK